MDFILLKDFFISYSLPTVIIALCVTVAVLVLEKIFKDKIPFKVMNYIPFILSVIIYVIYGLIISSGKITSDYFYAGILSGSLSTVMRSAINRISQGKSIGLSATVLLIESLLKGYVDENSLTKTAILIDELLTKHTEELNDDIIKKTASILKDNANCDKPDDETIKVATLIVRSIKALKRD